MHWYLIKREYGRLPLYNIHNCKDWGGGLGVVGILPTCDTWQPYREHVSTQSTSCTSFEQALVGDAELEGGAQLNAHLNPQASPTFEVPL